MTLIMPKHPDGIKAMKRVPRTIGGSCLPFDEQHDAVLRLMRMSDCVTAAEFIRKVFKDAVLREGLPWPVDGKGGQ